MGNEERSNKNLSYTSDFKAISRKSFPARSSENCPLSVDGSAPGAHRMCQSILPILSDYVGIILSNRYLTIKYSLSTNHHKYVMRWTVTFRIQIE